MRKRVSLLIVLVFLGVLFCGFIKDKKEDAEKKDKTSQTIMYDYHMHIFSEELLQLMNTMMPPDMQYSECSADSIISLLDKAKVKNAFVLSGAYIYGMDHVADENEYENVKRENNNFASQVAKYPDRLIGFVGVNPLKDYALEEIERCYKELNLKGIKIHCTNSDVKFKDPEHLQKMKEVFEKAEKLHMPIVIHLRSRDTTYGKEDVQIFLNELVAQYPKVKLQVAHMGGYGGFDENTKEAFRTFIDMYKKNPKLHKENIYLDLTGIIITEKQNVPLPPTTEEQLKQFTSMLREWGLNHIAWGSDFPTMTPLDARNYMEKTSLSQKEIKSIFDNDIYKTFFKDQKEKKDK